MSSSVNRSKITKGPTVQRKLGCGNIYIAIHTNGNESQAPMVVRAWLGRAGSCSVCQNEALTNVISLGLRHGVPVEEFIDELKGIKCPNPHLGPVKERNLSCADAIASALEEYLADSKV